MREPLLHFAWLAALLIWLTPRPPDARSIELSPSQIDALTKSFELKSKRPPTDVERAQLINEYLSDEVLKREAISMGLHETDPVVRRRLIQSLDYLAESQGEPAPPTDVELAAELSAHPERYQVPEELDFEQVFLRAGPDLDARVAALEPRLVVQPALAPRGSGGEAQHQPSATPVADLELGDAFLAGRRFVRRSERQVEARFGAPLAKALFEQARLPGNTGKWLGPFESRYGKHWVRVEARHAPRTQRLDEARGALGAAVLEQRRQAAHTDFIRRTAARYRIRVAGESWQLAPSEHAP
ncbi:MAG: peptidyl-prolyl cis-trans isomerase [Polyangiaceae bacterium]|nr:peptidyl-prolyl cis-trans isomerase [Myxococcales bacterium]MCB9586663.1 peptidyl-prolyl cis-trans isomerase [Polyangiaceae bacterium]MCB9606170.1 peptidyl-prolyl cis-trans isomerase [Polyangiaceae bacterium]